MNKTILRRKDPVQTRSMRTVDRICEATLDLLKDNRTRSITTTSIARLAGVNIATLYQYFPNKEAIYCTIYQKWLDQITRGYEQVEAEYLTKVEWEQFFSRLIGKRFEVAYDPVVETQLDYMMEGSRELSELDGNHAQKFAARMSGYLKAYGSVWDENELENLSLLLYELGWAATHRFVEQNQAGIEKTREWTLMACLHLIRHCLGK